MQVTKNHRTVFCRRTLHDYYLKNEADLVCAFLAQIDLSEFERMQIEAEASTMVSAIRKDGGARSQIDNLLQEYGLSTEEGVMLMRLSEALIRTPDFATARTLIRDKVGDADWRSHAGQSDSFLVNQATTGLRFTSSWISATGGTKAANLVAKLGDRVMETAMSQAMAVMGNHFVLGRDIKEAAKHAQKNERKGIGHSYDMLGEAAHTLEDADRYFEAYFKAIEFLAANTAADVDATRRPGLSVKLSALHPRYEYAAREECVPALVDRVGAIAQVAARAGLWLNIDAEEADRLEISLDVFERLLEDRALRDWRGLGMVVQAYQRRAGPVIDHIIDLADAMKRDVTVRLVKGAYWDTEIKRAQELGLSSYPVFTRKENTDVSYLSCAQKLLRTSDRVFPQFATHNAHTAVAIATMAPSKRPYEFQRLHGMGAALHDRLTSRYGTSSRIYAPVGSHKDLLPYLVRRLLENGANGSFVNQMMDESVPTQQVAGDPITAVLENSIIENPKIPAPRDIIGPERASAKGIDLTQSETAETAEALVSVSDQHSANSLINGASISTYSVDVFSPQDIRKKVGTVGSVEADQVVQAVACAKVSDWAQTTSAADRAKILNTAADLLEAKMPVFLELCVREAGKTLPDAVAEVREAVDFCRYYAEQARTHRIATRAPLGAVACISPWNFPLAIFFGQVTASLSVGNTVVAKPAPQTPIIAAKAVELLHRAGIPKDALHLLLGDGVDLGNALCRNPSVDGVCFTGSTQTAKRIAENLAETERPDIPFIAETGGINAMIVDSTALLEQAVQDLVVSAFQSAGQRCSACRIICVQDDIADRFLTMMTGAMKTLKVGDPAKLRTDVGPVIDQATKDSIRRYCEYMSANFKVTQTKSSGSDEYGCFVSPTVIEVSKIHDVKREVFGPVVHFVRFKASELFNIVDQINSLGFGLTMGLHTRLDDRVEEISKRAHVGNLYVNRNQIGAVVGVQPFGGEGLSGTGPKAGGPHYLLGLTKSNRNAASTQIQIEHSQPNSDAGVSNLTDMILAARTVGEVWNTGYSIAQRSEALSTFPKISVEASLQFKDRLPLPGPTGEENTLYLHPKGVLACFIDDNDSENTVLMAKALMVGSAVICATDCDAGRVYAETLREALPKGLRDLVQAGSVEQGLRLINLPIDGVCATNSWHKTVADAARRRDGAILPVLSPYDPIERFANERTLTVNTTAAGGNASLLALT